MRRGGGSRWHPQCLDAPPLRQAQSSTPSTLTGGTATLLPVRTRFSSVVRLTGTPSAAAWRAPGLPPSAKPMVRCTPCAAGRSGALGSGRRRTAVRRRSGAGTRERRTGTDEPGRAEASGGRSRPRRRGCASRRRGPAGTGCRTRDRMPWPRSSALAASPGGYHGRSGRGSGEWTGSRSNAERCSRTIPYRRMLLPIWRSFTAMPRVGLNPAKRSIQAIHTKLPRTRHPIANSATICTPASCPASKSRLPSASLFSTA